MPCAMVMNVPGMKNASGVTTPDDSTTACPPTRRQRQQRARQHHGLGRDPVADAGGDEIAGEEAHREQQEVKPELGGRPVQQLRHQRRRGARHHHEGAGVEAAGQHEGVEAQPAEQRGIALRHATRRSCGWRPDGFRPSPDRRSA